MDHLSALENKSIFIIREAYLLRVFYFLFPLIKGIEIGLAGLNFW